MIYLYQPPRKENVNATQYYYEILVEAFEVRGESVGRITRLDQLRRGDKVIALTANDAVRVLLTKRGVKVYTWFQGIVPEEKAFNARGVRAIALFVLWSVIECIALGGSRAVVLVSEAMARHYKRKYLYFKKNYVVMPCFNQQLDADAFVPSKYESPTFVYAGSLGKWQCFEKTVKTFKAIQEAIPDATFTVFTSEEERAKRMLEAEGLADVALRQVPYTELPAQMRRFKYGFLLREKHLLNKVATPTKMSSYLGSGVIPVFSPVIGDFNERLGRLKYAVKAGTMDEMMEKLKELEQSPVKADDVLEEYKTVFQDYYCRDKYVAKISDLFSRYR